MCALQILLLLLLLTSLEQIPIIASKKPPCYSVKPCPILNVKDVEESHSIDVEIVD